MRANKHILDATRFDARSLGQAGVGQGRIQVVDLGGAIRPVTLARVAGTRRQTTRAGSNQRSQHRGTSQSRAYIESIKEVGSVAHDVVLVGKHGGVLNGLAVANKLPIVTTRAREWPQLE